MVHALPSTSRHALHPDGRRIAGLAFAIVVNAALLMLLLVPMRAPPALSTSAPDPMFHWITPKPVTPPKPPVHVPVTTPHAQVAQRQQVQSRTEPPPVDPPILVDHGDQPPVDPPRGHTDVLNPPGNLGPVPGVRLEYADAPPPTYPRDALRDGVEGTVLLQVLVDVDGRPLQVDVQRSSGDRRLDLAAREQVLQHWRFRPAMQDGRAVQAIGLVPIGFHLQ